MLNMIFKSDSYISLPVPNGTKSGDPVVVGDIVGVAITDEGGGVGNAEGYASVALEGGARLNVAAGTTYAVGETVYITSAGAITKTSSGNKRFGKVTHEPKDSTSGAGAIIVKIVQ